LSVHERDDPRQSQMTATSRAATSCRSTRRLTALAGGLLAALMVLWMACCTTAPSASATVARPLCSGATSLGCARTLAIAGTGGGETEEPEEEPEGAEEAATAEVEDEEEGSEEGSASSERAAQEGVVLSQLRLTANATTALAHHHPLASAIGFSFTLSAATEVRVTLVRQTSEHGHTDWVVLPDSLSLHAKQGRVSHDLTGHNRLSPGRYRLTLKPADGRSRAIYLNAQR
jgi:hypothetical protein